MPRIGRLIDREFVSIRSAGRRGIGAVVIEPAFGGHEDDRLLVVEAQVLFRSVGDGHRIATPHSSLSR